MNETEILIQNWVNQVDLHEIFQEIADKIWLKENGFLFLPVTKSLEKYCN